MYGCDADVWRPKLLFMLNVPKHLYCWKFFPALSVDCRDNRGEGPSCCPCVAVCKELRLVFIDVYRSLNLYLLVITHSNIKWCFLFIMRPLMAPQSWSAIGWLPLLLGYGSAVCLKGASQWGRKWKKDEHKENCYITLFFNNGTLWCNHKTFTKYSHGDAVSQRHIYISSIIYLQIKKFILRAWFKCCCLESNLLLVTSYNTSILTSFTYRRICKLTRFMYNIYRNEPRHWTHQTWSKNDQ